MPSLPFLLSLAGLLAVNGVLFLLLEWWSKGELADVAVDAPAGDSPFAAPSAAARPEATGSGLIADLSPAFSSPRLLDHGRSAFEKATGPMLVGSVLMSMLDQGCNQDIPLDAFDGISDDADSYDLLGALPHPSELTVDLVGALPTPVLAQSDLELPAMVALGLVAIGVAFTCVGALTLLKSWIQVGWYRVHEEVILTGASSFRTLFGGADRLVPLVLHKILLLAVFTAPALLLCVPVLAALFDESQAGEPGAQTLIAMAACAVVALPLLVYVALGTYLGTYFVVLDHCGPAEALRRSWAAARFNRMTLIGFSIVLALFGLAAVIVGMLMLCIGLLVTVPLARGAADLVTTRAWLVARHGPEAQADWVI